MASGRRRSPFPRLSAEVVAVVVLLRGDEEGNKNPTKSVGLIACH